MLTQTVSALAGLAAAAPPPDRARGAADIRAVLTDRPGAHAAGLASLL